MIAGVHRGVNDKPMRWGRALSCIAHAFIGFFSPFVLSPVLFAIAIIASRKVLRENRYWPSILGYATGLLLRIVCAFFYAGEIEEAVRVAETGTRGSLMSLEFLFGWEAAPMREYYQKKNYEDIKALSVQIESGVIRMTEGKLYHLGPDGKDQRGKTSYDPTNGTISGGDIIFGVFPSEARNINDKDR